MQQLQSKIPGVYLTEISPSPVTELLTGVPIFFGLADDNQKVNYYPRRLTLLGQFEQFFSSNQDSYLGDAVRGFFENGGRLCYVMPLPDNTLDALKKGLEASEIVENIDLVCAPDLMQAKDQDILVMQREILSHCEKMGDRFAILDAVNSNDVQAINEQKKGLISNYGVLYAPWFGIENREKENPIPPCGHIAGIYAQSDRAGVVHSAPANQVIEGILDLRFSLTPEQQIQLNQEKGAGVNVIRSLRGRGLRVWGVRTLSDLPEWKYVNVRRLFLTFKRWIDFNLADTVFELNDFSLWLRIRRELTIYCESLWQQGALQGETAEQAFYVKCDALTNPPESREMGKAIAEIGLAPTIPGEFIQLLLVQTGNSIALV